MSENNFKDYRSIPSLGPDDEVDFRALGRILWGQRLLILAVAAGFTLGAMGLSFALPKTYTAEASILPASSAQPSSAALAGLMSQFGPAAGMLSGLGNSRSADLVEILNSRSMARRVIVKAHLEKDLKGWRTQGQLLDRVLKMRTVYPPSLKNKTVVMAVRADNPELAATVANAYVSELKDMLDEIGYNSAAKNRKFIETQLNENKEELAKAEDRLANFQASNQLASLPDTVLASIKSISDLEAQRIGTEVQIRSTDETLDILRSRVDMLQADPNALLELEVKHKTLVTQREALSKAQSTFLGKLMGLPPKAMQLARLQRDVQVLNAVYLALSQEYETAVISENKESEAFLPLDKADTPERPTGPKKALITIIGAILGLLFGVGGAFVRHLKVREG